MDYQLIPNFYFLDNKADRLVYLKNNIDICDMKESAVKDRILEVASRLFFEQGYNLTGINQIIEEADIARATLYNHFDSKTDLLLTYIDQTGLQRFEEMKKYIESLSTPKEQILGLFDFRIKRQQDLAFKGCQFIKITSEVSRDETAVFDLVQIQKNRIRGYIRQLVNAVEHHSPLSDELFADMVFLLLEGGTTSSSIYRDAHTLASAKKVVEKFL